MPEPTPPARTIPIHPEPLLRVEPPSKIQARSVRGRWMRLRWLMVWLTQLVFYGLPWLPWHGRQAVLFDLEARRFFLFDAVLYPQDLIYLTLLLVNCALLLFFATALAGRIWCGFACPQTVYTLMFSWIERRCEGDRLARLRLDQAPWSLGKLGRRGSRHLAWGALSLWTGFTFVGYFTPIDALGAALLAGRAGPWELFWTGFYSLATWGNAGFLREKVCQHMCPYGRFQGSMLDRHTLNVSYDARRGEPRGSRSRRDDAAALGLGACVDCTLCVQVCPVGIDIRQGLQSACINCGACIDACDHVMDRLQQPRGLIRFASMHALESAAPAATPAPSSATRLRRPRVLIYGTLLLLGTGALLAGLWQRPTLRLDVMRDRSVLAREAEDGRIDNLYRLLVINASDRPRTLRLDIDGPAPLTLADVPETLPLPAAETGHLTMRLQLAADQAQRLRGQIVPIRFRITDTEGGGAAISASTFLVPR